MKKFISMLAGVVMASSLFAATAFAADGNPNWSMTIDKNGKDALEIGDEVVITLASEAKSIGGDIVKVYFDTDAFECVNVTDADGYAWDEGEFLLAKKNYYTPSLNQNAKNVSFSWLSMGANVSKKSSDEFAILTFKAIAASEGAEFTLYEESSSDTGDGYIGYIDAEKETVVVNGGEPPYEPTWTAASSEWAAPAGKKAIWWPVDFAAGEFDGYVDVTVTNGEDSKTVGVGAANGFDIEGAVSFAVAVILDEAVDATYFDCVVE